MFGVGTSRLVALLGRLLCAVGIHGKERPVAVFLHDRVLYMCCERCGLIHRRKVGRNEHV